MRERGRRGSGMGGDLGMDMSMGGMGMGEDDLFKALFLGRLMEENMKPGASPAGRKELVDKESLKDLTQMMVEADLAGKVATIGHLEMSVRVLHQQLLTALETLERQKKEGEEELENQRQEAGQEIQRLCETTRAKQDKLRETSIQLREKTSELATISDQHRIYQGQVTAIRQALTNGHDMEATISKVKEILDFPVPVAEQAAAEPTNAEPTAAG